MEADLSRDKSASLLFPMLLSQKNKAVHHNRLLIKSNIGNDPEYWLFILIGENQIENSCFYFSIFHNAIAIAVVPRA